MDLIHSHRLNSVVSENLARIINKVAFLKILPSEGRITKHMTSKQAALIPPVQAGGLSGNEMLCSCINKLNTVHWHKTTASR